MNNVSMPSPGFLRTPVALGEFRQNPIDPAARASFRLKRRLVAWTDGESQSRTERTRPKAIRHLKDDDGNGD